MAETASLELACDTCGSRWPLQPLLFGCPACAEAGCTSSLHVRYPASRIIAETTRAVSHTSQWDFAPLLPVPEPTVRTTLGEGWTPLVQAERLAAEADARVLVKLETCNPIGAFKDRLNAVSVSAARQFGYQRVLCTTTGNHGVSLAAYAAVARLDCLVVCQPDVEPIAVQQMRLHGARVAVIGGPPAGVRSYLARLVRDEGYWPSVRNHPRPYANPFGLEGYKTIAYEIWLQLECRIPDAVFVPAGGRGLSGRHRAWLSRPDRSQSCRCDTAAGRLPAGGGGAPGSGEECRSYVSGTCFGGDVCRHLGARGIDWRSCAPSTRRHGSGYRGFGGADHPGRSATGCGRSVRRTGVRRRRGRPPRAGGAGSY